MKVLKSIAYKKNSSVYAKSSIKYGDQFELVELYKYDILSSALTRNSSLITNAKKNNHEARLRRSN